MRVRPVRLATLAAAVVVMTGALVAVAGSSANADPKLCEITVGGKVKYVVCDSVPGTPGNPGGGNGPAPKCELTESYPTYCKSDDVACLLNDPALNDQEDVDEDAGPRPEGDDYHVAYESCSDGSGRDWFWTTGETVSREDLALQAFGELEFPAFTVAFNPPARTYVNLATWWWAQGAGTDDLVGSAAGGIRALATPDHMEVDPGDGSGVLRCDFRTAKSDDCSHTYRRASYAGTAKASDGSRAYPARMRLVWDVRFEDDGAPLVLDGLPTSFVSPWQGAAVPVREIQTVVIPGR